MAVNRGLRMQRWKGTKPTSNVLPVWRGMLISTLRAAHRPSERLAKAIRLTARCQGSSVKPNASTNAFSEGSLVAVIPSGMMSSLAPGTSIDGLVSDSERLHNWILLRMLA